MPSRVILVASASLMAAVGLVATFLPQEILAALGLPVTAPMPALVQVAGAFAIGFAMLDWMSRGNRHGGIYGRPLVTANLLACSAAGLALLKDASSMPVLTAGIVFLILGAAFGALLFGDAR